MGRTRPLAGRSRSPQSCAQAQWTTLPEGAEGGDPRGNYTGLTYNLWLLATTPSACAKRVPRRGPTLASSRGPHRRLGFEGRDKLVSDPTVGPAGALRKQQCKHSRSASCDFVTNRTSWFERSRSHRARPLRCAGAQTSTKAALGDDPINPP